jgi:hypothetical protein
MEHLKTQKQLNESPENLNISDVSDSKFEMIGPEYLYIKENDERFEKVY